MKMKMKTQKNTAKGKTGLCVLLAVLTMIFALAACTQDEGSELPTEVTEEESERISESASDNDLVSVLKDMPDKTEEEEEDELEILTKDDEREKMPEDDELEIEQEEETKNALFGIFGENQGDGGEEKSDGKKLSGIMLLILLIIVLIVAAVIVLLIVRHIKKKKREEEELEKEQKMQPEIEQKSEPAQIAEPNGGKWIDVAKLHNIGKRESQQDSMGIKDDGAGFFAVVADGMGGLANGDKISQKVVVSMLSYAERIRGISADNVLFEMIFAANRNVNTMLGSANLKSGGSTLVAVYAGGGYFHWASVGDSRIYLYRNKGLIQLNREHNYESDLIVEAINGKVPFSEIKTHPQRHGLTSYIGMGKLAHVEGSVRAIKLQRGDRILLMSDGVYNTLSEKEMCDIIESSENAQKAAEAMEKLVLAYQRPKQDNFTAIIAEVLK